MRKQNLLLFTGNANRPLALSVCRELGVPLGKALVGRFSDGEVQVEIEENVRGQEVFVLQPTSAPTAATTASEAASAAPNTLPPLRRAGAGLMASGPGASCTNTGCGALAGGRAPTTASSMAMNTARARA